VCYFGFSRYADDFIVIAADRDRLEQVLPSIRHFLAERGLELNEDKTRIVDAHDGFNFLGFTVRKYRHGKCLVRPQKAKVLAKLREWKRWLRQHANTKPANVIMHLNLKVSGWANYYQHANSSRVYSYVDHRLWQMLWSWCIRRHPNKSRNWLYRRYFTVRDGRDWVFTGPDTDRRGKPIQAYLARVYRPHRDHALVRGTASPLDPALAQY
jgi:RNA-directed DNA polymerase